ncbi:uncharacterized protein LOC143266662 [Megachile rotundata]|uniref:uncharacterized protein LOC143266662 n=1 Tax=Megachile rotundata TaxID=143995 RepID=UPI003FD1DE5A
MESWNLPHQFSSFGSHIPQISVQFEFNHSALKRNMAADQNTQEALVSVLQQMQLQQQQQIQQMQQQLLLQQQQQQAQAQPQAQPQQPNQPKQEGAKPSRVRGTAAGTRKRPYRGRGRGGRRGGGRGRGQPNNIFQFFTK